VVEHIVAVATRSNSYLDRSTVLQTG